MSTLTIGQGGSASALDPAGAAEGRLAKFFRRLIEAREREAKQRIANYLGACSDQNLRDLGLKDEDIRDIRAGRFNGIRY